jgi:hypothetical protein
VLPPFALVDPAVRVTTPHGESVVVARPHALPHSRPRVVFVDESGLSLLERALRHLVERPPGSGMSSDNRRLETAVRALAFWNRFFTAGPRHWGGWDLETAPVVASIEFFDEARTKAGAHVAVGSQGLTVLLEKRGGAWYVTGLADAWIA